MNERVTLATHQEKAFKKLKNGSILYGGVGSGKTITALAYYMANETPKDIYVITTARKRDSLDWEKEAALFAIGKEPNATVAGILHVDSWNNIQKYKEVKDAFFIFDEQRLVGSGTWTKSFIKLAKHNNWIMLSATPGDTWLDYIPVFVANGFYKNRTQFKNEHVVYEPYSKYPKVRGYLNTGKLIRYRNQILVHMPYKRHTKRHEVVIETPYDKTLMDKVVKKRWHVYEERPLRDVAELFSVARKIASTDATRLETVRGLMEKHPKLIVFYNFDYELEILRTLGASHGLSESRRGQTSTDILSGRRETLTSTPKSSENSGEKQTQSNLTDLPDILERSDAWRDTIFEEGWAPGDGERDPRSTFRMSKAKYEFEAKKRKEEVWNKTALSRESETSSGTMTPALTKSADGFTDAASSQTISSESMGQPVRLAADISERNEPWNKKTLSNQSETSSSTLSTKQNLKNSSPNPKVSPFTGTDSFRSGKNTGDSVKAGRDSSNTPKNSGPSDESTSESMSNEESSFAIAEWNGHKHEDIPDTESWVYLVQYVAGAEAWNCTDTNAMVFWSLTYSFKNFEQAKGRIDRLNTPFTDLYYYILTSKSIIEQAVRKSLAEKKTFNERDFVEKLPI